MCLGGLVYNGQALLGVVVVYVMQNRWLLCGRWCASSHNSHWSLLPYPMLHMYVICRYSTLYSVRWRVSCGTAHTWGEKPFNKLGAVLGPMQREQGCEGYLFFQLCMYLSPSTKSPDYRPTWFRKSK